MVVAIKKEDKEILYKLIREHEDVLGSSRIAMLALRAFIQSIKELKCIDSDIKDLFTELSETIKSTEPRIVPLIHLIKAFEMEMQNHFDGDSEEVKKHAIRILTEKHDHLKKNVGKVIEHGLGYVNEGDVIIVHTASYDVTNMLVLAKDVFQKNFKVLILKQDFVKTKQLISALSKANIELLIIPEYSLSHYIEKANKLFIGAVSITHDMKIISAIGTANIVSLCHLNKIPVYLFANSLKFSYHPTSSQKIHMKEEVKTHDNISYILTTHSHDMVDLKFIDYLITEDGEIDKTSIKKYL